MMKRFIYQLGLKLMILSAIAITISSCKKEDDTPAEAARIFKPSDVKVTAGETLAKLTWTTPLMATSKALKYTIDFSTDSLFSTIKYTTTADTAGVTVTEDNLSVRTKYYARVKANATDTQPESKYVRSSSFQLSGTQFFRDDLTDPAVNTVTFFYKTLPQGAKIVLTPETGTTVTVTLTAADILAKTYTATGLLPNTKYSAELFVGAKSYGYVTFTTLETVVYTIQIGPADNLATTIANAADKAVIGLADGTYNLTAAVTLSGKTITLRSISNNPAATKVNFKGFTLLGTGAGLKVVGIDFDGTTNSATYFADLTSASSNATAAAFTSITADNCRIHGIATGIVRGDRSTVNNYSIGDISFNKCLIYDVTVNNYYMFHLNKLLFKSLSVTKSTLYNFSPGLVNCTTVISAAPTITFEYCTINNAGGSSMYLFLTAGSNPVSFSMKNSIIANTPKAGLIPGLVNATSTTTISYNNSFNLTDGSNGNLVFPASAIGAKTINLGWTATTTNFKLAADSPLLTASSSGGAIGDPRWTY